MGMEKKIRILFVEDNPDDYFLTSELLKESALQEPDIDWVTSAAQALEKIKGQEYDLYLVDHYLDIEEGLSLIPRIQKKYPHSAVIVMTGRDDPEIDRLALEAGASDYLVKGDTDARLLCRSIRYALEHSRLRRLLYQLSIHDELTGIYNRREFNREMEDEINRYNRYKRPLALIMLDMDHFKTFNDTYGHPVGDHVLKRVAETIQANLRSTDKVCRYGGDEFAIILPETSEEDALRIGNQLLFLIDNLHLEDPHSKLNIEIPVSLNMGIATVNPSNSTVDGMTRTADKALYTAKNSEHTRIVCAKELTD